MFPGEVASDVIKVSRGSTCIVETRLGFLFDFLEAGSGLVLHVLGDKAAVAAKILGVLFKVLGMLFELGTWFGEYFSVHNLVMGLGVVLVKG